MANPEGVARNKEVTAIPGLPADVAAGASGAAAVVTYAAAPGACHIFAGATFSYDAAPQSDANLKVEDGAGNIVFQAYITSAGIGPFSVRPRKGTANTAMIVTLSAGGGSVNCLLTVDHWTEVP
jgi:hypothetical protein